MKSNLQDPDDDNLVLSDELRHLGERWLVRALILVGSAPMNLAVVIPRPHLAAIDAELGGTRIGDLLVKTILTVVGVSIVIASPFVGAAIRAAGHRAVLVTALLLFVTAGTAPFFVNNIFVLTGTRALLGVAMAAIQIGTLSLAGELYEPAKRAKMIGFMVAASAVSAVVMGPLSGIVGEWGWRNAFLLYGVLAPFIFFAWFGLPKRVTSRIATTDAQRRRSWSEIPVAIIVLGFLGGLTLTLPAVFFTFKFREIGVDSSAKIGLSFLAVSIPEVIVSAAYGWTRRYASSALMGIAGFATACLAFNIAAFTTTLAMFIPGLVLYGISVAWTVSSLVERASVNAAERGRNLGLLFSAIYIAAIGGTIALEPVFLNFGASGVLLSLAGISIMAILFMAGEALRAGARNRAARAQRDRDFFGHSGSRVAGQGRESAEAGRSVRSEGL